MSDTEWRWADPSGQQRLVRTDELRAALASGVLAPNTPVWRSGWKEWKPAYDVPELTTSALAAANGVLPNIPPPPLAVVAVQAAFESSTGSHVIPPDAARDEPPAPPRYVPAPTRPRPGMFHTPSQPMKVPAAPDSKPKAVPPAAESRPKIPQPTPSQTQVGEAAVIAPSIDANTGVALKTLKEAEAHATLEELRKSDVDPPTVRPNGDDHRKEKIAARPLQAPAAPPKAMGGLSQLVRASSRPPPPNVKPSKPPPPKSVKPPPPKAAAKENIEELSGSMLMPDASSSVKTNAIEELSGSILLTDVPGTVKAIPDPRQQAAPNANATEELSGSFLLDAGSTGALPSLDSDSAIRATSPYQPQPAPFAAPLPAAGEPPRAPIASDPSAIHPLAMPLGPASVPPPQPNLSTSTSRQFAPRPIDAEMERITQPVADPANAAAPAPEHVGLPTLVGVPPPPDMILNSADAAIAPPRQADVAPVPAMPMSKTPMPAAPPSRGAIPSSDAPLPPPERSDLKLHDFRALSPDPRMKFILPAVGLVGTLVMLGVIGLVIGMFRKKPSDEPAPSETAESATASAAATAPSAPVAPAPAAHPAAATIGGACALAGAAHVVAPRAIVASGVEVQAVGSRLALGFATGPKQGLAVAIDPASLVASQTVRVKAPDTVRRLVPLPVRGLGAAADVERAGDPLSGRRTVSADPPFDLGLGDGGIAWTPYKSRELDVLWPMDGDTAVEALRAAPLDPSNKESGWAIAFRRGASIFAGAIAGGATLTAKGPLVKIDGLGPQVGSPAVAAQDGAILVAWADRAQPSDPWSLRWMRFQPGDATADAKRFVPGEGGLGEHAMSPAIAPAGQGRFVLAWTEGPVSSHQVRAQTISGAGVAVGAAFTVSEAGVNAGQAQLAVLPDGHGVIAYLAANDTDPKAPYSVIATPIACP